MKELSIEEKAKRYDEAIEKFDVILNLNTVKESGTIFADDVRKILPELKESEDERIRTFLHHTFTAQYLCKDKLGKWYGESVVNILDWLEKQGEHANFRNKIQIGDKVTRNEDGVLVNLSQLNRVAKKQGEQKPIVNDNAKEMFIKALERVEEQNAKGYKLTDCDKNSWWEDFKNYTSCTIEQKPTGWSEEDEEIHRKCICAMRASACGFPEEEKLVEQVDNWLKSLRERVQPQPKQEWSEEDELIVAKILCICNDFERSFESSPSSMKVIKEDVDKIDNWLRTIKDRYTWKPSEEQIKALEHFVRSVGESGYASPYDNNTKLLYLLLSDLKKLKG